MGLERDTIICGDCLKELRRLPSRAVQMCVTSPPYWGLRNYNLPPSTWGGDPLCEHEWNEEEHSVSSGGYSAQSTLAGFTNPDTKGRQMDRANKTVSNAFCTKCGSWKGCLGLEPTHDCAGWATGNRCGACYVCHLVEIFAEVRRVLRDDGVLFLNMGDSYATGAAGTKEGMQPVTYHSKTGGDKPGMTRAGPVPGLPAKNLCGIPWRVALALQANGWWLRRDIIWAKGLSFCPSYSGSSMPESVTDRPSTSHEYVFLLSKRRRYFYDNDAVREPHHDKAGLDRFRGAGGTSAKEYEKHKWTERSNGLARPPMTMKDRKYNPAGRNLRSVWVINPRGFKEAHFATYPEALIRPMILAGTSARGACPECQAPWRRVVERTAMVIDRSERTHPMGRTRPSGTMLEPARSHTLGWRPTCGCYDDLYRQFPKARKARKRYQRDVSGNWWKRVRKRPGLADWDTEPCLVLDPFLGSGTTAVVAKKLGRSYIGIELNPSYIVMAEKRLAKIDGIQLPLLPTQSPRFT